MKTYLQIFVAIAAPIAALVYSFQSSVLLSCAALIGCYFWFKFMIKKLLA